MGTLTFGLSRRGVLSRVWALAVLIVPATLAVGTLHPGRALADVQGCQVGVANPQQAWAIGQTVNVDVDLSDPAVVAAVQQAFTNWQNSPAGQAAMIVFNVRQLPLGSTPTGQYLVEAIPGLPANEAAVTTTVPTPQVNRTSATTSINQDTDLDTNPDAVLRIMAHEIGHTFGLPDAFTNSITGLPCDPGTSVMNPLDPT